MAKVFLVKIVCHYFFYQLSPEFFVAMSELFLSQRLEFLVENFTLVYVYQNVPTQSLLILHDRICEAYYPSAGIFEKPETLNMLHRVNSAYQIQRLHQNQATCHELTYLLNF